MFKVSIRLNCAPEPTYFISVLCTGLKRKGDDFPLQLQVIGFCKPQGVGLVADTTVRFPSQSLSVILLPPSACVALYPAFTCQMCLVHFFLLGSCCFFMARVSSLCYLVGWPIELVPLHLPPPPSFQ